MCIEHPLCAGNLRIKRQGERQQAFIWDRKELRFWEAVIQAETQLLFRLGGEGKGYLWEREGD